MNKKKIVKIFFILSVFFLIIFFVYSNIHKKDKNKKVNISKEQTLYNSNIIQDVEFTTRDKDNNKYYIKASQGEIDFENSNIIYLTDVYALIELENNENVTIFSDYGKYNSENYDTIFTKNVKINYLNNKITSEYLDFSLERNSMIISNNVVFSDSNKVLKTDVVEIDIKTKNTKFYMYDKDHKVSFKTTK